MCAIHTRILLLFYIAKLSTGQLNGEFWWLNEKFVKFSNVQPPQPKFEELTEFDTDESSNIVFRDSNLINNNIDEAVKKTTTEVTKETKSDRISHVIVWPVDDEEEYFNKRLSNTSTENKMGLTQAPKETDVLAFKFPEYDNTIWRGVSSEKLNISENSKNNSSSLNKSFNLASKDESSPVNCTYLTERDCYQKNGIIHYTKYKKNIDSNLHVICCVLPSLKKHYIASSKIRFPDEEQATFKRFKRSKNDEKHHQVNQRNILLQRRYNIQSHKTKSTTPKIITLDYENNDPYWNIKTGVSKHNKKQANKGYDDSSNEYQSDYVVEVPRPGLAGIYSDYGDNPYNRPDDDDYGVIDADYDDVDDDETGFGYSTVDPRKVTKPKIKRKPTKLVEKPDYAETQTISYHSKPDFNVLQGFKLKLLRNQILRKSSRKSTTVESIADDDSKPIDKVNISHDGDDSSETQQVFPGCGQFEHSIKFAGTDRSIGGTLNGSHPFLTLVVPTRKRNTILCYASLVHPRAAITAAHCVARKAPGDITIVAGIWDMTQISRESRVPSIRLHPNYVQGSLSNDLALLYWTVPLEMGTNIQPACLADPHFGDECMFFGWGGFDQAVRRRSRWQKATIRSCKRSVSLKNGVDLPREAFCATVLSRSTVTGVGGSLICNNEGTISTVGVTLTRDSTLVLLPIRQWVISVIDGLKLYN